MRRKGQKLVRNEEEREEKGVGGVLRGGEWEYQGAGGSSIRAVLIAAMDDNK